MLLAGKIGAELAPAGSAQFELPCIIHVTAVSALAPKYHHCAIIGVGAVEAPAPDGRQSIKPLAGVRVESQAVQEARLWLRSCMTIRAARHLYVATGSCVLLTPPLL